MDVSEIAEAFAARPVGLDSAPQFDRPRYNICPTQTVLTIRSGAEGREAIPMRWGFLPHWYRTPSDGPLLINARAETIAEKPAFHAACRERRCLIPVIGFYEWQKGAERKNPKTPYYIHSGGLFAVAGIWQSWAAPESDERIDTCAIVTCAANQTLAPIHHRMPVVIAPDDQALWLGEAGHGAAVLMKPADEEFFHFHPVSAAVNSARLDTPNLIEAAMDG